MLSKIYFPRLVVPASAVIVSLIDFLISMVVLALIMVWYGFVPDWRLLTVPFFLLLVVVLAFGIGSWLAALNVKYRDFRHIVPFVVQIGLFISPVGFSSSVIPERWKLLYSLNPMVGVIDGFRWAILGNETALDWRALALAVAAAGLFLVLGVAYFRKTERVFADVI
jgi:lipopolysaccharide transport system permease protein